MDSIITAQIQTADKFLRENVRLTAVDATKRVAGLQQHVGALCDMDADCEHMYSAEDAATAMETLVTMRKACSAALKAITDKRLVEMLVRLKTVDADGIEDITSERCHDEPSFKWFIRATTDEERAAIMEHHWGAFSHIDSGYVEDELIDGLPPVCRLLIQIILAPAHARVAGGLGALV